MNATSHAAGLRRNMHALKPIPTRYTSKYTRMKDGFQTRDFVFARIDAVCKPLQPWMKDRFELCNVTLGYSSLTAMTFMYLLVLIATKMHPLNALNLQLLIRLRHLY